MALEKIGALWKRESKGGKKYMSGIMDVAHAGKVVVFANDHKTEDRQPDYKIYRDADEAAGQEEAPF